MTAALIVRLIRFYQAVSRACIACGFAPFALFGCRQWPSCSEYSIEAIREHGPIAGSAKALARIASCNPLTLRHVH